LVAGLARYSTGVQVNPIIWIVAVIALGIIPGAIAQSKGESFVFWWLFGALLFIVALPLSLMIKPKPHTMVGTGMRRCPYCAEYVQQAAIVCRFCGRDLPPATIEGQVT